MKRVSSTYGAHRIGARARLVGAVALCMLACACTGNGDGRLPLYTVERMPYVDMLAIEGYTESLTPLTINCPPDVDGTIVHIVETGTEVEEGDTLCVIEDANIADNYERWTLNLESMQAELEKLHASQELERALLDAQVRNNDIEALLAEADSLQMLYMSPSERRIKELQREKARIEREQLMRRVETTKELQKTDVMKIERQIAQQERRLEGEREKIASLTLRAPRSGIAVRARRWPWSQETWNIGDNVWNGRAVVMMPDMEHMKVIIYAPETEYKRLHEGDSVAYAFDAMPENRGWGRITKLSPVGQTRTEGSAVKTFEIEASVDSLLAPVDPGLSVQCRVYLHHVADTVVVPTISVFDKDSLKVVYVEQRNGHYEERTVTLGENSPRSTIIASGLRPGERIALVKPKSTTND